MNRNIVGTVAVLLSGISAAAMAPLARGQQAAEHPTHTRDEEPPGRDLFVPYVPMRGEAPAQAMRNVQQLRILAEMNKLTVELVKRRSNRYITRADTAQLIKRLKELAKELHERD